MPPHNNAPPAAADEMAELRQEVADLRRTARLLVDAIDEVREELQYLNMNGVRLREAPAVVPVLERMASDPCAEDWNERLVIDYRTSRQRAEADDPVAQDTELSTPAETACGETRSGKLITEPANQRELF